MSKIHIAAVLAATLISGGANAATVSYFGSTGVAGSSSSLALQQFDASLGTLTGISIDWDYGFNGTFRVVQDTLSGVASAQNGFVSNTVLATSTPAGATGPSLNSFAGTAFSVAVPPTYSQFFAGGKTDTQSFGPLSAFIGLGMVTYNFFSSSSATATVSEGLLSGIVSSLHLVNADITYTYDDISAVPVPAAIWLFGSGLVGLVGVARRKKV